MSSTEALQRLLNIPTKDRKRFVRWLYSCFKETERKNVGKSIEQLQELYDVCYPGTDWSEVDTELMLRMLGIVDVGMNKTNLLADAEGIPNNKEILYAFLKQEKDGPVAKRMIDRVNGEKLSESLNKKKSSLILEKANILTFRNSLDEFYHTWCVKASEHKTLAKMNKKWHKTPLNNLIDAYHGFCQVNHYPALSRNELIIYLETHGHRRSKGYAAGKSGVSYLTNLYVPGVYTKAELGYAIIMKQFALLVDTGILYDINGNQLIPSEEQKELVNKWLDNTYVFEEDKKHEPEIRESEVNTDVDSGNPVDSKEVIVETVYNGDGEVIATFTADEEDIEEEIEDPEEVVNTLAKLGLPIPHDILDAVAKKKAKEIIDGSKKC